MQSRCGEGGGGAVKHLGEGLGSMWRLQVVFTIIAWTQPPVYILYIKLHFCWFCEHLKVVLQGISWGGLSPNNPALLLELCFSAQFTHFFPPFALCPVT